MWLGYSTQHYWKTIVRSTVSLQIDGKVMVKINKNNTQYIIIAYCFIIYYNTEVQLIATICIK